MLSERNEIKQNLMGWIDENKNQMIKFLQELIAVPSEDEQQNIEMADFLARRLKEFGFDNTQELEVIDSNQATQQPKKHIKNVLTIQSFGTGRNPEIVLNAYGDTVPPGIGWEYDPYDGEINDGKLYGRGASIAKSDISAYTFAVLALKAVAAEHVSGKVDLAYTFDGESGGLLGPNWLLNHQYIHPNMAITPGFTHSILNAHKGCLQYKITVTGKSAHSGNSEDAHDALEAMNAILHALYTYRKNLNEKKSDVNGIHSPTLTIGLIKGGTSINVVPDQCEIKIDRRFIPEESAEEVEKEIDALVREAADSFEGIHVAIEPLLKVPTFGPISEDTTLIQKLSENWRNIFEGETLKIGGIPLYSDARHYANYGIPTVMFGVGPKAMQEANSYQANEHIEITDLLQATKIITLTLFDLLERNHELLE